MVRGVKLTAWRLQYRNCKHVKNAGSEHDTIIKMGNLGEYSYLRIQFNTTAVLELRAKNERHVSTVTARTDV